MKKITLIICGGTLAMVFALSTSQLAYAAAPVPGAETTDAPVSKLQQYITDEAGNNDAELEQTYTVCLKDSTAMTPEDLTALVEKFNASGGNVFLVVHGSDTMKETANYLAENADLTDKTVVFVSSAYPFIVNDDASDAQANLDAAITACTENEPGIYFCTANGEVVQHETAAANA